MMLLIMKVETARHFDVDERNLLSLKRAQQEFKTIRKWKPTNDYKLKLLKFTNAKLIVQLSTAIIVVIREIRSASLK